MAVVLRCVFGVPRIRLLPSALAVLVVIAGAQVLSARSAAAADCPDERADAPAAAVTAKACAKPVEVASVFGYTSGINDVPPGYRVRFDDGLTAVIEIPRL